jgi:hypothetical protein
MSTDETAPEQRYQPVHRAEGVTAAERYLKRLCDRSFLSLWSHAGIYHDQGKPSTGGHGKELCDLLVIFQDDVLIFSDKDCAFPNTGRLALDWSRWFRKAVMKSADQVWGAERKIKVQPDRLFLDRACTHRFPIDIPDPAKARYHRIVVAHDSGRRCRAALGGSGSLMINPRIIGDQHCTPETDGFTPFAVGQLDPRRGYVHVFDDRSLGVVMSTLDTITDFVGYLTKKEAFITSGRLGAAAGEEELLALYLANLNAQEEHDFVVPAGYDFVGIPEGHWEDFVRSPQRRAQLEANEISYAWDALIERFGRHIINGTSRRQSHPGLGNQERLFRFFAREPRTRRRFLARSLIELIERTPPTQRATRVIKPSDAGDPYYVLAIMHQPQSVSYEKYRETRANLLEQLCLVTKLKFPDALDIIGVATEGDISRQDRSEDTLYLDAREWTEDMEAEARSLQQDLGLLENVKEFATKEYEFPVATPPIKAAAHSRLEKRNGSMRNSPCLCGSGKKYKKCCGR